MKKTFSKLTCTGVSAHAFKPELDSAELRQTVTTSYPTRTTNSEGLFSDEEYNLESQDFTSERVCWIDVPKGTTPEQVQTRIDKLPNAKIKRILSMRPILSDNQKAAIAKGITTLDKIKASQTVSDENGEIVLWNGNPQYKKLQPSWSGEEDVDLRPAKAEAIEEDVIIATEIATEAAAVTE
jgi:hypothetical protein